MFRKSTDPTVSVYLIWHGEDHIRLFDEDKIAEKPQLAKQLQVSTISKKVNVTQPLGLTRETKKQSRF